MRSKIFGIPVYLWAEMLVSFYITMAIFLGIWWVLFGPLSATFWPTATKLRCPNQYMFLLMQFVPHPCCLIFRFLENAIQGAWLCIGMNKGSVGALKSQATVTFLGAILISAWKTGRVFMRGSLDNVSILCLGWSALSDAFRLFSAFIVYRYQSLLSEYLSRKSQQPAKSNNDCVVQLATKKRNANRQRVSEIMTLNEVSVAKSS